jgi:DNA-binding transcriptional MocR family regulator
VYLQSTLHSPTGALLPESRRREIAAMVSAARVPLVEDMALADLAWCSGPPPLAAFAPGASVAVVGSLSKLFWGGLRIGFVRAPEAVALRFARIKATHDLGSSATSQLLAERLLRETVDGRFLRWRRQQLQKQYRRLTGALRQRLPEWEWPEPQGGLSMWIRLPGPVAELFAAAALDEGVAVATAQPLSASGEHDDRIRVSFAAPAPVLEEGVRRLEGAWRSLPR